MLRIKVFLHLKNKTLHAGKHCNERARIAKTAKNHWKN